MPKEPIWWARTTVDWQSEDLQDQLVLLPAGSARHALAWRDVMACTTWTEVRHVAPGLEAELRDYAEDAEWAGDHFDFTGLAAYEDGALPPPPERAMDQRLPRDLIDTLGVSEDTVFDGPFVRFPGDRVDAVLAWLDDHGYDAVEHPELGRVLQDPSDELG
ncbi:MAG: hypothetical protein E6Q90_13440 [Actinobacteria bacterium]|nr:MAG: hypothetical protein E6Q90_13440 [Actinomycetota bacterium]